MRRLHTLRHIAFSAAATVLSFAGCYGASDMAAETAAGTPPSNTPHIPGTKPGGPGGAGGPGYCATATIDPGTVTLHRLNRVEYDNTVRDLLGDTSRPAKDFPNDDRGYGFDNNADVLSLAPLLMEKYEIAAERLVEEAWARDFSPGQTTRIEAESATQSTGASAGGGTAWNIWSNGTVSQSVQFSATGEYTLSARAWGQQAGTELPKMEFRIDGQTVATFDVSATSSAPQVYSQKVQITAGARTFAVAFANDFHDPASGSDRNLMVDWFEAQLPGTSSAATARVRICNPSDIGEAACAQKILGTFARRAWRRTVTPAELDRLMGFLNVSKAHGEGFDAAMKLGLQAILLSPNFLFRVEIDPDPNATTPHPLNDFELATRLSYFLWSSTPDDTLLALAEQGALSDKAVLAKQVDRMLADPKADALVENFAGQWLETRAMDHVEPNAQLYPSFNDALRADMKAETDLFFRAFLKEGLPVRDMLDANFTYLNDRLAAHYGLPLVGSDELKRVTLPAGGQRGGLLTQGAFLSFTSHPDRTSPVKRGQWVLAHLLCQEPPPPPPEVENLGDTGPVTGTLRQRMEQHRSNPTCAGCHSMMDPIGFGFENFDAVGQWRTKDEGFDIDATGQLPTGHAFSGPAELKQILKEDPKLSMCIAKNMLTYAIGRGHTWEHECMIQKLADEFDARGGRLTDLIHVITQSETFTMRRGGAEGGNP